MSGLQGVRAVRGAEAKERQVQQLWDNTPNGLEEQAKYNLAMDFINVLKKRTEESYLKVGMKKGRFHIIKRNKGVVPDSKRQGRPPLLSPQQIEAGQQLVSEGQGKMNSIRAGTSGEGSFGGMVVSLLRGGSNNQIAAPPMPSRPTMRKYEGLIATGGAKTARTKKGKRQSAYENIRCVISWAGVCWASISFSRISRASTTMFKLLRIIRA